MRIISLLPSLTELVFELGMGSKVVGVSDYCAFPPEVAHLPRLGGLVPDVSRMVELAPSLVIADVSQEPALKAITDPDIRVVLIPATRAETIQKRFEVILKVGQLVGRPDKARQMVQQMEEAISKIEKAVEGRQRPRVLYVSRGEPLKVAGGGGIEQDIIRLAGGQNVGAALEERDAEALDEFVVRQNPSVILAPQEKEVARVRDRPGWRDLEAVRKGRVFALDLRHHPDPPRQHWPTLVEDIQKLARLLHPEAFSAKGQEN